MLGQVPAYGWQITHKMGVVRVSWPILNLRAPNDISETAEAGVIEFYSQVS